MKTFEIAVIPTILENKSKPKKRDLSCTRKEKVEIVQHIVLSILILLMPFIAFSQSVKRVISLAPSITENVYLVGAKDKLVGCTSYCTQAVAEGVDQVGSTVNVNIEKLFALQPDLVLTMQLTKPQELEAMRNLGLKVEVIPTPKSFNEICEQTIYIGKLLGNEKEAKMVVENSKQMIDSLQALVHIKSGKLKIFFQLGAKPIFAVLQNTFLNDYILMSNCENIANGLTKGVVSRESVLIKNPDVIVIAKMGGYGAVEKQVWETYEGMSAVKNNKVFLIDSETSCSPTPENFVKAFADVVKFVNQ